MSHGSVSSGDEIMWSDAPRFNAPPVSGDGTKAFCCLPVAGRGRDDVNRAERVTGGAVEIPTDRSPLGLRTTPSCTYVSLGRNWSGCQVYFERSNGLL